MAAIRVALIGLGRRGRGVYLPVLSALRDELELVAVCDRLEDSAQGTASELGVPAFTSVGDLVDSGLAEAAIICTPPESHHAISLLLSRHRVHHVCETPMAMTRRQCRQMAQAAAEHGACLHVNEQFFRRELLVLARRVIAAGAIGEVHRITFFHAHTGYHNNSVIQFFAGGVPATVSAFEHTMPLRRHLDGAGRWQERETFRLRVMHFAGGMLVTDAAANIKSALGRCPRPGYMEIDGTDGAIVEQPGDQPQPWEGRAEVRLVAEDDLLHGGYAESFPVERVHFVGHQVEVSRRLPWNGHFHRLRVRLPGRTIEYENPMASRGLTDNYLSTVAQSTLDFCRGVRGQEREFTVEMAVASQDMEAACARSAAQAGAPVALPLPPEDTPEEQAQLAALARRYGADPMDAEAMLDIAFPKNYVT